MLSLMLLSIFFIVGMIAGAFRAYRLIATSRKPGPRSGALLEWSASPLPSWKFEPHAVTAILIHTLSVLVLGVLALRAPSNPGPLDNPLFAGDATMNALVWFVENGSLLVVGYQLGALLIAFPLIVYRREPVSAAIKVTGLVHGQNFLPWRWFSHFSVDKEEGLLRLFSAFSPDLPSLTMKLPGSVPPAELTGTLQRFLPMHPPGATRAWYRSRALLIPTMLVGCLPIVGLGWLASHLSRELALFLIALLAAILVFLGGLVLNKFAFGVLTPGNRPPDKHSMMDGNM